MTAEDWIQEWLDDLVKVAPEDDARVKAVSLMVRKRIIDGCFEKGAALIKEASHLSDEHKREKAIREGYSFMGITTDRVMSVVDEGEIGRMLADLSTAARQLVQYIDQKVFLLTQPSEGLEEQPDAEGEDQSLLW